ncbi:MAG: helix-turn-helix domain containing protein [Nitrospiraceae bacterium]
MKWVMFLLLLTLVIASDVQAWTWIILLPLKLKPPQRHGPVWTEEVEMVAESAEPIERWTAKRRMALVVSILKGETSAAEAARQHGLTVAEVQDWREKFLLGGENALRSRPRGALRTVNSTSWPRSERKCTRRSIEKPAI